MIGTVVKSGPYKITIKSQFGRWLVGQNGTLRWVVVDRTTNEIVREYIADRKSAEKIANNRLIKDQDAARRSAA